MLLLLLLTNAFVLLPWAGAGRIIGGWEVKPHSRPYMAYLKIKNETNTSSCGGFLIRPDAVLSAAHCVADKGPVSVTVTLGAHNISVREKSQQKFHVRHWVKYHSYSRDGYKNDIVLLQLKQKAKINKNVQVIPFAKSSERVKEKAECSVCGWGWTSVTKNRTDVLREVKLKVQNEKTCQHIFRHYQNKSMICVGDEHNKKATYKGDSGGPLVCNGKAHGIVSRGKKKSIFPKVFTRISYFEPWIREQLRKFDLQELPGSPSSD